MSKRINVNPGQYKVAGRERQGEQLNTTVQKQALGQQRANDERWAAGTQETLAPAARRKPATFKVERAPARKTSLPAASAAKRKTTKAGVVKTAKTTAGAKRKAPGRKAAGATKTKRT